MQADTLNQNGGILKTLEVFAADIKLSHSIFALPFVGVALTMTGLSGLTATRCLQIVTCMILARSFAMGANRYLDRHIDKENERTKSRALPAGRVNESAYLLVTLCCAVAFVLMAFTLSNLAGFLSPLLLLVLGFYSLMKKISWGTHWYLGFCLGLAPIATQLALYDEVTRPIILLGMAVTFWTAGFDILYSLQDREFDRSNGLHSAPAMLGHKKAIWLSRLSFVAMILCLNFAGRDFGAGFLWGLGVVFVALILGFEHWLIRDAMTQGTSKKINVAFFNLNALVSVVFLFFALLDFYGKS